MLYCVWFKDLNKDSLGLAGGKGTNLGIMYNLGMPVPNGFAVSAQTYREFLHEDGLKEEIAFQLKNLDVQDTKKLQEASKRIQDLIKSKTIPEEIQDAIIESYELLGTDKNSAHNLLNAKDTFVAVRSSATAEDLPEASFAGQQATFLNVKGKDAVLKAVQDCWASLFTARAIFYREKNNFDHMNVFISAIVQKMVNSERSGVMFTINPSTNNDKELVVEAVCGLGETIVGGQVTPDLYIVDKKKHEVVKAEVKEQEWGLFRDENGKNVQKDIPKNERKQRILNDKEVLELARLGKKLEEHYKKPQDVEWAIEKDEFYIVQTRAVTTFKKEEESNDIDAEIDAVILLKGQTASKGVASGKVKLIKGMEELEKIKKGDILVTTMTTPDMVPAMQKAAAIVTNQGGLTSHAAIVSRELGIPCIVGTEKATEVLKDDQIVTVHASRAVVFEGEVAHEEQEQEKEKLKQVYQSPGFVTATEIKVIVDIPEVAEQSALTGADGVGLVRLEIIIANGAAHPAEYIRQNREEDYVKLLKDGLRKIAQAFVHKPIWVRCSDLRTDEYRNLQGGDKEPEEDNPMMGWHAVRRLLDEPRILKAEFKAVKELHEEGFENIGVMIPFVINVDELKKSKEIMREVGLEPVKDVDFGVMIETPASCWIIEDLCKEGMSFVSFGTNDLTQLTLGIDRNNERIANQFNEMHPAVLGEIAQVIKVCQKYKVTTSICGQAGSRPEMAEFLVHQGVDSISANADSVNEIRKTVARVEKKLLLDAERSHDEK